MDRRWPPALSRPAAARPRRPRAGRPAGADGGARGRPATVKVSSRAPFMAEKHCIRTTAALAWLLNASLAADQREVVREHLRHAPRGREELARTRTTLALAREAMGVSVDAREGTHT